MVCQHNNCERKTVCLITLPSGNLVESCLIHSQGHKIIIKEGKIK